MSGTGKTFYRDMRKKPHEFENREDFLNHDLTIMSFRRWGIHLPSRDYSIEIEALPALSIPPCSLPLCCLPARYLPAPSPHVQSLLPSSLLPTPLLPTSLFL